MKKFVIKIALFFVIMAIIDFGAGIIGDYLQTHAKGGIAKRTNDLAVKDYHDILILGSSRAHSHYDTPFLSDTTGLDVYNAGYDGNGVILAYGLLEMILERYRPQLIVYDVEPAFDIYVFKQDNNNTRYLSYLKPYYKDNRIGTVIKDISEEEWYKVHSGLIRYNSNFVTLGLDNLKVRNADKDGGYDPIQGEYEGEKKIGDGYTEIDPVKLLYIERLILLAKENNIPLAMVASPKYSCETIADFQPVIELCNKHEVPFWDYYSDELFMQHKEWFKEPMHLNSTGARIFSRIIFNEFNTVNKHLKNERN